MIMSLKAEVYQLYVLRVSLMFLFQNTEFVLFFIWTQLWFVSKSLYYSPNYYLPCFQFLETNKKWCVLEGGFLSYYENDKCTTPNGTINISEVICLVVHKEDFYLNTGYVYPSASMWEVNGIGRPCTGDDDLLTFPVFRCFL